MKKCLLTLLVCVMAAVTVFSFSGCLFNGLPASLDKTPQAIPADQLTDDDRAAVKALTDYFDAYSARDIEAMTDSMCSDCRLRQLNQANGATRDNFVELMKSNVAATDAEFGTHAKMMYDSESIAVINADEYIDTLNEEFRIDAKTDPVVDMARIIEATVWFDVGFGNKEGIGAGSMLVYRYNGEWFIYGYAG